MDIPNNFKLLVTDLDGTAVPMKPDGMPSKKVVAAIKKAQAKIHVTVATGRPFSICEHILKKLNITDICVIHGGTQLVNPQTKEMIWHQFLTPEIMANVSRVCEPYVFEDEGPEPELSKRHYPIFTGNNEMMVLLGISETEAQFYNTKLKAIVDINTAVVTSWLKGKFDLHISHIGASKRHALEVLMAQMNIKQSEVMAVGDGGNDLPLFEAAGFRVAMGNASPELKAKADYITDTVDNDGLAAAIEKFIL